MKKDNNLGVTITDLSKNGFTKRVVLRDGIYTYIADAMPSVKRAEPKWSVCRVITENDNINEGTTDWANGTNGFNNKADDLTSLPYS